MTVRAWRLRLQASGAASRFLSPEMYTGLLAAYAGEHELRRWTVRADRYALAAESVIYAWWLAFLAMLLWVNLSPGLGTAVPGDMAAICKQVIVVFFGSGVSRYFHIKAVTQRQP